MLEAAGKAPQAVLRYRCGSRGTGGGSWNLWECRGGLARKPGSRRALPYEAQGELKKTRARQAAPLQTERQKQGRGPSKLRMN